MPPKIQITKEDIINTAVEIVRNNSAEAINARNIAAVLKCSTQPIFSNFVSMEELHFAVVKKADEICYDYIKREIESKKYPPYKASGMAYIRFAKEEKELFKLLYMRDRTNEVISKSSKLDNIIDSVVHSNTGLDGETARLFHLEMWAYVHGIAVMVATNFENLGTELISRMLTDAYQGMRKQYGLE